MDKSDFPKLDESVATPSVEKSALGSSWAEVAQPNNTNDASTTEPEPAPQPAPEPEQEQELEQEQEQELEQEPSSTELKQKTSASNIDHRPNAWEATKDKATFADIAGHEKKQAEEFPTPQESLKATDTESLPTSGGVGDLLNSSTSETNMEGKGEIK